MDAINKIEIVDENDRNMSEKPKIHRDKNRRNNKSSRRRIGEWLFQTFAGGITCLVRICKCNAPDEDQLKSEHHIEANESNNDINYMYQPSEKPSGTR